MPPSKQPGTPPQKTFSPGGDGASCAEALKPRRMSGSFHADLTLRFRPLTGGAGGRYIRFMNDRAPLLSRAVRGKKGFRTAVFVLVLAAAAAGPAAAQQAVILVRHAEKADSSKDSALSEAGRARAEALAVLVAPLGITAVYASECRRARLTAEPAAAALGLKVQTYAAGDAAGLAERLRTRHAGDTVLVIGHSNTLPELMRRLGHPSEEIIADDDYGSLFVLLPQTGDTPVVVRLHY